VHDSIAAVKQIYAELAARPVTRNCTGVSQCCRFRLNGRTPFLTKGEAMVAAQAWRAAGRKEVALPVDGSCPFLGKTGLCQIYNGRPFGCRTHFCDPAGGPYGRQEVRDLIHRLETIDRQLGGNGGVNLPVAVAEAMRTLKK
jgi:hypothetical protein